jgi:hypothetical protein
MIGEQNKRLEKLYELLDAAWTKELGSERGYSDWKYIVATAITRVACGTDHSLFGSDTHGTVQIQYATCHLLQLEA